MTSRLIWNCLRRWQAHTTFLANDRAGIMVTHDLRMCQFVDRVLQMQDGKLAQVYESKNEIMELAQGTTKHKQMNKNRRREIN